MACTSNLCIVQICRDAVVNLFQREFRVTFFHVLFSMKTTETTVITMLGGE